MGRSTITANGRTTNKPGVYGNPKILPGAPAALNKNLALVGAFPWTEKLVAHGVVGKDEFLRDAGADAEAMRLAKLVFGASADARVPGGPRKVYLVNVCDSERADLDLLDAASAVSISVASTALGTAGNRTTVALRKSGTAYSFTVSRDGVSRSGGVTPSNYLGLQYTDEFWTAVNAAVTTTALTVSATKSAALGGSLAGLPANVAGVMTFTPSVAPASLETYTLAITGTTAAGGAYTGGTTWAAGESAAWSPPALSAIATLSFTTSGVSNPSLAIAGPIYVGTFSALTTVAALVADLGERDEFTLETYETTPGYYSALSSVASTAIDPFTSTSVLSNVVLSGVKAALVSALNATGLVTATAGVGAVPVAVTASLSGGTQTSPTLQDYVDGLAALEEIDDAHVVVPLSTDIGVGVALKAHVNTMRGAGEARRSGRFGYEAGGQLATRAEAFAAAAMINSPGVVMYVEQPQVSTATGGTEWLSAAYLAVCAAAMVCAMDVARPLTYKYPDLLDVRNASDWSPRIDHEAMVDAGVAITSRKNKRIRFHRDTTTFIDTEGSVQDLIRTEPSCDESLDATIDYSRRYVNWVIGENSALVSEDVVKGLVVDGLVGAKRLGYCQDFDRETVSATLTGDKWVIGGDIVVTVPINFVELGFGVAVPGAQTVSFTL